MFQLSRYYRHGELDACDGAWSDLWECFAVRRAAREGLPAPERRAGRARAATGEGGDDWDVAADARGAPSARDARGGRCSGRTCRANASCATPSERRWRTGERASGRRRRSEAGRGEGAAEERGRVPQNAADARDGDGGRVGARGSFGRAREGGRKRSRAR